MELLVLVALLALSYPQPAASQFVDCEPEGSCSGMAPCCMVRLGPTEQSREAYDAWRPAFEAWRMRVREALEDAAPRGFEAYDEPAVAWSRSDWVQAKTMLHDRYLFDRDTNQWTVQRYLDDLTERYGGVDSVVLWQYYPNGGVDDRNQFDMIASLPGGIEAVRTDLVGAFEAAGVKVFWAVFPWDGGTRPSARPMYEELTELIIESGAHGLNGDTLNGVNVSWWDESMSLGAPLVLEPEWMKTNEGSQGQGFFNLAHNVASWGQTWGNDGMTGEDLPFSPQISAYKALEPRHTVHITDRWAMNRTSNLQTAFFNGIGYLAWESVWCNYNQITERSGEELRRIRTIYKGIGEGLLNSYSTWNPHVPVSTVAGVFASEFTSGSARNWTLWTVVNRAGDAVGGDPQAPALELPCQQDSRFFDIWTGVEIVDFVCNEESMTPLPTVLLEAGGYACVLRSDDGSAPPADFLDEMAALASRPLSSFDPTWRFLRQNPIVPSLHLGCPAGGCPGPMQMVLIPFSFGWDFRCSSNQIEPFGDQLATAVDVQFAWEPHPMR